MIGKIGVLICVLAAVVTHGTAWFWLAVVTLVTTIVSAYASAYRAAKPQIDALKHTTAKMESEGASAEEITAFLELPHEQHRHDKAELNSMFYITIVSIVVGAGLLMIGLLHRF